MRPQTLPPLDYAVYSDDVINAKHTSRRRRLKAEKNAVNLRVDLFLIELSDLKSLPVVIWKKLTTTALQSCYDSATIALTQLKDDIIDDLKRQGSINLEKCPYCMLQPPSTWDHYLPQVHYPEFSIYHGNLVYVCSDCNRQKLAKHNPNQLEFLHPYFYGDATKTILFCKAIVQNNKLGFQYYSASLDPALAELAAIGQRHIANLKLETDFQLESATVVSDFPSGLKRDFPGGIGAIALTRLLRKNYKLVAESLGANAWEARLWHALAACPNFHTYVSVQLPLLAARRREGIDEVAPPLPP